MNKQLINIKCYKYDDEQLVDQLKWLWGSDEWRKEHKQDLRRSKNKKFYLLYENDILISISSIKNNLIGDAYTFPQYRNQGYYTILLQHITTQGLRIGTSNEFVLKIIKKLGYKYIYNRGKYEYYEKM